MGIYNDYENQVKIVMLVAHISLMVLVLKLCHYAINTLRKSLLTKPKKLNFSFLKIIVYDEKGNHESIK